MKKLRKIDAYIEVERKMYNKSKQSKRMNESYQLMKQKIIP